MLQRSAIAKVSIYLTKALARSLALKVAHVYGTITCFNFTLPLSLADRYQPLNTGAHSEIHGPRENPIIFVYGGFFDPYILFG
jgi:hypothetical protein